MKKMFILFMVLTSIITALSFIQWVYISSGSARAGVDVSFQLPNTPGEVYRVTLAITDPDNPDWIVSQFACGVACPVTTENKGLITMQWDGLDDNYMPLPAGTYGVKGIYMPARLWNMDNKYHTLIARWNGGGDSWMPSLAQENKPIWVLGDPCLRQYSDVDVGPNGIACFYHQYLENASNNFMVDLNKPIAYEQVLRSFGSWAAGGGCCTATDGVTIWSASDNGPPDFVYRTDGAFGTGTSRWGRKGVSLMSSQPNALAAVITSTTTMLYVSRQDGSILVLDGKSTGAEQKASLTINGPKALAAYNGSMYVLHSGNQVSRIAMNEGIPSGSWLPVFTISGVSSPFDLVIDSRGGMYVSDPAANQVYKLNVTGGVAKAFGSGTIQVPGQYNPNIFMRPAKMATWKDASGNNRLIVVETNGPCRISEWSSDGVRLRDWVTAQTQSNDGWSLDPDDPTLAYILGSNGEVNQYLTRFKIDYATGKWTVDAVWPNVTGGEGKICKANGRKYWASASNYRVYRFDGDRLVRSAGIESGNFWSDANNDGQVQSTEYQNNPASLPAGFNTYWKQNWASDLSFCVVGNGTRDCWTNAPGSFDAYGNPQFKATGWKKVITDPIFVRRSTGTANALYGGNELDDRYSSDWARMIGLSSAGYWVMVRGGKSMSANDGPQVKISYYQPTINGGYQIKWRTGRRSPTGSPKMGEIRASLWVDMPVNGLLGVVDNSWPGYNVYTADEGLFVDQLFLGDAFQSQNVYGHGGEFFAGGNYLNPIDGNVYIRFGKAVPSLFKVEGWTATGQIVNKLTVLDSVLAISQEQISPPLPWALALRPGWTGPLPPPKILRFTEGRPSLDGSLNGWDNAAVHSFAAGAGDQTAEVRCMYQPDTLYLRWHVSLGISTFVARTLQPVERIFTHDRRADVMSLYFQGDANLGATGSVGGRPGDVRIDAGIFNDNGKVRAVAIGLYPKWYGPGTAYPATYGSPISTQSFESVAELKSVKLRHVIDQDNKGFVIAMAIPRQAIPLVAQFGPTIRTRGNFSATFGGATKFWWANTNNRANIEVNDEPSESRLYPECWTATEFYKPVVKARK